jgi:16S rRNA (adenine1518-N6/adenine1519-N6)-dimethyltransferase
MTMSPRSHRPRKRFGQHFLQDRAVIERTIEALRPGPGDRVVEIGPGHGALTGPLLERVTALEVIEIDRDLARELEQRFAGDERLRVHCLDALRFDFCRDDKRPLRIVGNLPYNISTPLLFHLLEQLGCITAMVLMLQKEVAGRISADPGGKDYGRLSVMVQSLCRVETLFRVPAGAFSPPPRVESAVIRLQPAGAAAPRIDDRQQFARLVRSAFSRRRKTLRNALRGLLSGEDLEAEGVDPNARPEQLPVAAYARLANRMRD